jgi:hypothetical protein
MLECLLQQGMVAKTAAYKGLKYGFVRAHGTERPTLGSPSKPCIMQGWRVSTTHMNRLTNLLPVVTFL